MGKQIYARRHFCGNSNYFADSIHITGEYYVCHQPDTIINVVIPYTLCISIVGTRRGAEIICQKYDDPTNFISET